MDPETAPPSPAGESIADWWLSTEARVTPKEMYLQHPSPEWVSAHKGSIDGAPCTSSPESLFSTRESLLPMKPQGEPLGAL